MLNLAWAAGQVGLILDPVALLKYPPFAVHYLNSWILETHERMNKKD